MQIGDLSGGNDLSTGAPQSSVFTQSFLFIVPGRLSCAPFLSAIVYNLSELNFIPFCLPSEDLHRKPSEDSNYGFDTMPIGRVEAVKPHQLEFQHCVTATFTFWYSF